MEGEELERKIAFFEDLDSIVQHDEQHDEGLSASMRAFAANTALDIAPLSSERPTIDRIASSPISNLGHEDLRSNTPLELVNVENFKTAALLTTAASGPNPLAKGVPATPTPQTCVLVKETPVMKPNSRRAHEQPPATTSGTAFTSTPTVVMSSMPRASLKRKKSDMIRQVPLEQRIFNDLIFFFVPNNDISVPRRLRIRKAIEFGATWVQEWHSGVTHVVVDNGLEHADVLRALKISELPGACHIVKENYPADCISFRLLLNPKQRSYEVAGIAHAVDQVIEKEFAESSAKSLQLKPTKGDALFLEANTPSRTEDSLETSLKDSSLPLLTTAETALSATDKSVFEPSQADADLKDPFQQAIAQARATSHLLLESDDEEGSGKDAQDQESENGESSAEEREKRKKKKQPRQSANATTWQENFRCMQDGKKDGENPNAKTIGMLQEMANYYESSQDRWRSIAYRKAISSLRGQPARITTKEEAEALPFVGSRLAAKIEEIVWTNRLRRLENAKAEPSDEALQLFLKIYGVGFSQASKWIQQGHKAIDDLLKHVKLSDNQRIGIDHLDDFQARIPRAEVTIHGEIVTKALLKINPAFQVIVGGSYRRGAKDSGDVDVVVTLPDAAIACVRNTVLERLVPELQRQGYLTATLAATSRADGTKWHGACQLPIMHASNSGIEKSARYGNEDGHRPWRRIDFLLVPWEEMGAAMIYFTGDDIFNRSMRLLARKKGMRLNQRGLYKDVMRRGAEKLNEGTKIEGRDEKEIFRVLGVPWREPTARIC